jgi:hypothetical protein
MSQREDDEDIEAGEREPLAGGYDDSQAAHPKCVLSIVGCAASTSLVGGMVCVDNLLCRPTRSIHAMTREEIRKGIANRVLHSRTYIILYLAMAALSITTVVLSMREGCPGLAFYILEIVINSVMIAEVVIRFFAFGRVSETVRVLEDAQLTGGVE